MLTLSNGRQTLRRVAIIPIVEFETDSPRVPGEVRSALQRHLGSAIGRHSQPARKRASGIDFALAIAEQMRLDRLYERQADGIKSTKSVPA